VSEKANDKKDTDETSQKRTRQQRQFPAGSFQDSFEFAQKIFEFGSGAPVRRLSFFDHLGKSPDSGASRQLIVNANKYGLTKGSYAADQIELTEDGLHSVDDKSTERERRRAHIKLGIQDIEPFSRLFEKYAGSKLPAQAALIDATVDAGVDRTLAEEAAEIFVLNLKYIGLLQVLSGAERVVKIDHLLDSLPSSGKGILDEHTAPISVGKKLITSDHAQFEKTCFYITPIGEENSEERKHSDLFLGSIVEPSVEKFNLNVVRADKIDKPGFITKQIIDYIVKSRLVIADLSFHNPNVFYELAIRHAIRKPVIQLISRRYRIPFDVNQSRTIVIDDSSVYTMVPAMDAIRSELSNQLRRALESDTEVDTPLSIFMPSFRAAAE
jgi:hypothetical protein